MASGVPPGLLYELQQRCREEDIDIESILHSSGASNLGVMPATKFKSALVVTFSRLHFTDAVLNMLVEEYGCSYAPPEGTNRSRAIPFEAISTKDFCDDVRMATPPGEAAAGGARFVPTLSRGCDPYADSAPSSTPS